MSTESYSKWWIRTKQQLANVQTYDEALLEVKSIKDRSLANHLLGGLYARYAMVVQDMDVILDQMVQVQKSFTVRKMMDATVQRLNELKEELTKLDISEYHYIDGALIELKLIPHEVEIIHPLLVFPRRDEYEQLWRRLKNGESIYEAPAPGTEGAVEEGRKKKGKKVKVDPLALLKGNTQGSKVSQPVEPAPVEEDAEVVQQEDERGAHSVEERLSTDSSVTQDRRTRKRKQRVRPKYVFQGESDLTTEEKAEKERRKQLLSAIILIQSHERARQGRLYHFDSRTFRGPKRAESSTKLPSATKFDFEQIEGAAITIQRFWRGHLARQWLRRQQDKRDILIGMSESSQRPTDEYAKFRKGLDRRREIRDQAIRDYYQALIDEKARVLKVVAPGLFEDIGDEIRQWFKDWYYTCKTFKDIPPAAEGGTILVIRGDVESPEEHVVDMLKSSRVKGKAKDKQAADAKAKEKKAAEEKKKKEKEKAERALEKAKSDRAENYEFEPTRTAAMMGITEGFEEYEKLWAHVNDADNPTNLPYMDIITEQKCYEMQMEVRPRVDEMMRIELELLKQAVEKDKWLAKKKKGSFKPKKKKKKKKGGKGGKEKKGKGKGKGKGRRGKKDPLGNRKVEDAFQELYKNGIIREYPEVHIDEYFGDFSYQNFEKREKLMDPPATLADARQAVIMNCILPLGVEKMNRARSVLIVGPRGSNLDVLANAVFTETRSVLFDLSSGNVKGKYPGKKGNKELSTLVAKLSKLLAPSVIFVDNAEKMYYKKVPKEEKENDPKRVGKFLSKKIIKTITPSDRVLVLGTSYSPWLGQAGKLRKTFPKILLVPRSDYGSVYLYWRKQLMGYHGVDRKLDVSVMALLTQNYTLPQIKEAIEKVLEPKRLIQLSYKPLELLELYNALREIGPPVDDQEWSKYLKFYGGTKLGKQRRQLMAVFDKQREAELKGAEKAKMKK